MSFKNFNLDHRVEKGLHTSGYEEATPIQAASIPVILQGQDVIGTAQTGTGKTAAFVLPILHLLLAREKTSLGKTKALIVTPTRELAEQIHEVIGKLGRFTPLRSATVYGGVGMLPQEKFLRKGTELIVACPGRLLDHIQRGSAKLDQVEILVLDEADRMLDMGFLPSIQKILQHVPAQRQTLLFSATFESSLEQLIHKSMRHPQRISMGFEAPASTVEHTLYPVAQHLKTNLLLAVLKGMDVKSILVFTRTKHRADRLVEKLAKDGYTVGGLHSNKSQGQRKHALDQFRAGRLQILVATDIAARGLDIAAISHVVNYDIPNTATTYIHRIGRTGRAARSGDALTLVTPEDRSLVQEIEKILGKRIDKKFVEGFDYKAAPREHTPADYPRPYGTPARKGIVSWEHRGKPKPSHTPHGHTPAAGKPAGQGKNQHHPHHRTSR